MVCDTAAAQRFFRRLLKKTRTEPRVIVTDKLRSYGAAHREVVKNVLDKINTRLQLRNRAHAVGYA